MTQSPTDKPESFSKLLERTCNASIKYHGLKRKLDSAIEAKYGFHYSDRDLDWIIDSIDYGSGGITFKHFDKIMRESKP